jgi:hypothetical protein
MDNIITDSQSAMLPIGAKQVINLLRVTTRHWCFVRQPPGPTNNLTIISRTPLPSLLLRPSTHWEIGHPMQHPKNRSPNLRGVSLSSLLWSRQSYTTAKDGRHGFGLLDGWRSVQGPWIDRPQLTSLLLALESRHRKSWKE